MKTRLLVMVIIMMLSGKVLVHNIGYKKSQVVNGLLGIFYSLCQ